MSNAGNALQSTGVGNEGLTSFVDAKAIDDAETRWAIDARRKRGIRKGTLYSAGVSRRGNGRNNL